MVNKQGRESGGSWFETCLGVWYPRRRPCGVAINTLVDLINWLGKPKVLVPILQNSPVSSENTIQQFKISEYYIEASRTAGMDCQTTDITSFDDFKKTIYSALGIG